MPWKARKKGHRLQKGATIGLRRALGEREVAIDEFKPGIADGFFIYIPAS